MTRTNTCPPCTGQCRQGRVCLGRTDAQLPQPEYDFLSGSLPPRPPRTRSDRAVMFVIGLAAVLPALCAGCVAFFGRHS